MESINFEATGGQFGVRRVLGTFTLRTAENGRLIVKDDRTGKDVGFGYANVEAAVKSFKGRDDYRLL